MKAIRLGRMTALSKPDGGVRGIVVGDFLRRLVARTTRPAVFPSSVGGNFPVPTRPFHQCRE